ncbi:MAG: PINc/VapC family ATPase [Thaumarchaeota archaeon]|nr:PINc/VapC family ATPase [Nitrososphaerota archaeon]
MIQKVVLDTSVIIDQKVSPLILSGEISEGSEVIVPIAALDELQAQASKRRDEGFVGLEELTRIRQLCDERKIKITFEGERPSMEDIRLAGSGRIDAIIRDVAKSKGATLLTADYVQALVGKAEGIEVKLFRTEVKTAGLKFESFFDDQTLSLHLKEGVVPFAKKGLPGNFDYMPISDQELRRGDLEELSKEISEAARVSPASGIEISRIGATVIQLGQYRVAIARPPFSDGLEVTIVRPLVRLSLSDYKLSDKLTQRLATRAEGVLIAGPPGSGKSTLASSIADFYLEKRKVVKTFESPKDLQVSKGITQYGALEGDFEKTAEILLLVRPDYTIFDEVRKTRDFQIFADMRLAGVGMVGVVHASDPVNAVQRFMTRVELGMIPHIVDTVIFVRAGKIERVLDLNLVVKVPSGMNEPDLARPVVDVRDFETGNLVYEIYTFGEENVVIPIEEIRKNSPAKKETGVEKLATERILQVFKKYDPGAVVRILSPTRAEVTLEDSVVPRVIGKGGSQIKEIEEMLSMRIDVKSREDNIREDDSQEVSAEEGEVPFDYKEKAGSIDLFFDSSVVGKEVSIFQEKERILTARIGEKARLRFSKKSEVGKKISYGLRTGKSIRIVTG